MAVPLPNRETCYRDDITAQEFWLTLPPPLRARVTQIRRQKAAGKRPNPSSTVIGDSQILPQPLRNALLDQVACLVDENIFGRSEMCFQFASLLEKALRHLGLNANAVAGIAKYQGSNGKWFEWDHAWVSVEGELIDGNPDILSENPAVPTTISMMPYWGAQSQIPLDREYEPSPQRIGPDSDVDNFWWPELERWLCNIRP